MGNHDDHPPDDTSDNVKMVNLTTQKRLAASVVGSESARFGSIPMRPARSPTPTPVKPSASSLQMASSSRSLLPCTQDPAPVSSQPPEELVDPAVSVNVRVRPTPVCLAKLYGCAVSVSSAVS